MAYSKEALRAAVWPETHPAPHKELHCRHCGRRNRVRADQAVLSPEGYRCARCGGALFLTPDEALSGMRSAAFEHPLDAAALSSLKRLPGFSEVVRMLLKHFSERSLRMQLMANTVHCNQDQFPELVALVEQARARLGYAHAPTVFLGESPFMNAMTMGIDQPVIVFNAAILDQLDDLQIVDVAGHEIGHLMADHIVYRVLAIILLQGSGVFLPGLVRYLSLPLRLALLKWSRCAELTSDRAGLLASRDLGASLGLLLRMAGGNRPGTRLRTTIELAPFVAQARSLADQEAGNLYDSFLLGLFSMGRTHPLVAWRVLQLIQWVEHGNYLDILAGDYARTAPAAEQEAP